MGKEKKYALSTAEGLIPELRFPEFDAGGNYVKYLFTEIFLFATGKNIKQSEASPEFKIPCVRYGELYHMYHEVIYEIINKTNLDRSELHFSKGDEILLPSAGEDPLDIGSASALTLPNIAIGRTINILRPLKENLYLPIYVSYYINQKLRRKISTLAKGSSISNVYNSDLKKLELFLTSLEEQRKIASFLSSLDELITIHVDKLEALKEHKKGLLQNLFPQDGKKVPNYRFPEFASDDEWGMKELEHCLDYLQPTPYIVQSTNYNEQYETPVLTAGKSFVLGFTDEKDGVFKENLPVIIFDDFTTSSKFVDFPFKTKSSAMKILLAKNNTNIKFVYEFMQTLRFEVGVHKRHWISVFTKLKIALPKPKEQQKIASCFSALDESITAQTEKIEQLQQHKKGLMQGLFPKIEK